MWWKNYYRKSASYWGKQQETAVKTSLKRGSNWVLLKSQILILEPVCNQCYTDILIHVVHEDEKLFKTPHTHKHSRVGKRSEVFQLPFQYAHYWLTPTHHRITEGLWLLSFPFFKWLTGRLQMEHFKVKCYLSRIYYNLCSEIIILILPCPTKQQKMN